MAARDYVGADDATAFVSGGGLDRFATAAAAAAPKRPLVRASSGRSVTNSNNQGSGSGGQSRGIPMHAPSYGSLDSEIAASNAAYDKPTRVQSGGYRQPPAAAAGAPPQARKSVAGTSSRASGYGQQMRAPSSAYGQQPAALSGYGSGRGDSGGYAQPAASSFSSGSGGSYGQLAFNPGAPALDPRAAASSKLQQQRPGSFSAGNGQSVVILGGQSLAGVGANIMGGVNARWPQVAGAAVPDPYTAYSAARAPLPSASAYPPQQQQPAGGGSLTPRGSRRSSLSSGAHANLAGRNYADVSPPAAAAQYGGSRGYGVASQVQDSLGGGGGGYYAAGGSAPTYSTAPPGGFVGTSNQRFGHPTGAAPVAPAPESYYAASVPRGTYG
jgi:hypothetical protein